MHIRMIKRRIISIIAALVFLVAISGCSAEEKGSVYMNINAEKAKEMMENLEEFVLLDARSEEEFFERAINRICKDYDYNFANELKNIYLKKDKKLQQKENIIKEVREYIEKNWISQKDADNYRFDDEELDIEISDIAVLFDILDKEVD